MRIRNEGPDILVALAMSVNVANGATNSPLTVFADSEIDAAATPLSPEQERVVQEGRRPILAGRKETAIPGFQATGRHRWNFRGRSDQTPTC
jgi:hypothetical protein